jgi:hypothetical protein
MLPLLLAAACSRQTQVPSTQPTRSAAAGSAAATSTEVHRFCGSCHNYPPADSFPRSYWHEEVSKGYSFYEMPTPESRAVHAQHIPVPPMNSVVRYYEERAPETLSLLPQADQGPAPVSFTRTECPVPGQLASPAVSNVNLVHLSDPRKLDLLACDMRQGRVMAMKPYEKSPHWQTLATLPNPCHTAVVDLDGDGIKDILVACLGSFTPTDAATGSVVWLKGRADGTYQPITLLSGVGRVADVEAADFNGDGKLDLVVGVFGWQTTGEILYLENQTTDWHHPRFARHVLDTRHGTIHVPVCDLNGDGKPDFVALISQEHETVVAFLNDGHGNFHKETIYTAPHPAYGSTGIQVVDLDGDGKPDVLYTNGDILDKPYLLKPYHGIHWLRNRGRFPFEDHLLTSMCGVHRAVAADFRGTGRLDIVAVSFLPKDAFPDRKKFNLDSVIYLEQTKPGQFVRHSLEAIHCDHATCAAGAWDGDGHVHFVTGNFCLSENVTNPVSVTLWK